MFPRLRSFQFKRPPSLLRVRCFVYQVPGVLSHVLWRQGRLTRPNPTLSIGPNDEEYGHASGFISGVLGALLVIGQLRWAVWAPNGERRVRKCHWRDSRGDYVLREKAT